MTSAKISILIFLAFLAAQGGLYALDRRCAAISASSATLVPILDRVMVDTRMVPPRRVAVIHTAPRPGRRPDRPELPPEIAWTLGHRMNWDKLTVETLRWIPGISRGMAKRLLRIRDLYDITDFSQLTRFPHVGEKTIQRLKNACFIPHAA